MFHALAGSPPYDVGDNLMGALYRIVNEDPPRLANAGWLAPLLESTMTRAPGDRWSMAQVRDFLTSGPSARVRPVPSPVPVAAPPVALAPDPTRTDVLVSPVPPPEPGSRRRRSNRGPILVVLAILVLLGLIAWALLSGDDPENASPPASDPSSSSPSSPKTSKEPKPNADAMEDFISQYLATAPSDPESTFQMLTPKFQEDSGGIEGYRGFWDTVESANLLEIQADPDDLTVAYRVQYTMDSNGPGAGEQSTDSVNLQLVFEDGNYKIAGES